MFQNFLKKTASARELCALFKPLRTSPARWGILFSLSSLLVALACLVVGQIRMNRWEGAFFRAVERKEFHAIQHQAFVFILIMLILLALVVGQNLALEHLQIRVRAWLSNHLLNEWITPGRAYRLSLNSTDRWNPDYHIQEDVRRFVELSGDLGLGIVRSIFLIIGFVGVLWTLSRGIQIHIGNILIPGYMFWFALIYAAIGSLAVVKAGSPLISISNKRYTREANFRYSLVRIHDNAESISFYEGEKGEQLIAEKKFQRVLYSMRKIAVAHARLTTIAVGHGWMVVILPVLIALPGYLKGFLDFGGLMMAVGAFNQVQQALRWFVENFWRIAEWRAVLSRLVTFKNALENIDKKINNVSRIQRIHHKKSYIGLEEVSVTFANGTVLIADATTKIFSGDKVLLVGESGSGKSTLLRAISGLWPWGSGKIRVPLDQKTFFLPQRPYIPLGDLATALSYPSPPGTFSDDLLRSCLIRVCLEPFVPDLHRTARWDKTMSLGQQQRLAFARVLLQRPQWVFLDEATSALDESNQHWVMSIFTKELADTALLSIAQRPGLEKYHTRILQLMNTPAGRILAHKIPSISSPPLVLHKPFQKTNKA